MRHTFSAVEDFALAFYDAAYGVGFFAYAFQHGLGFLEFRGRNYQQHAEAHVEGAQHFVLRHISECLQMLEDGLQGPGTEFDQGCGSAGKHAREIFGDAASGDVGQGRDALRVQHFFQRRPVTFVGAHQLVADFVFDFVDVGFRRITRDLEQEFASEGISVGVQAVRGQAENDVADLHVFAGDDAVALDHADDEAGEVIFAVGLKAGHFGGLAADQGASVMLAGGGQAFDNFFGDCRVERAGGQIVHEKQWGCALHKNVVHAVVDQVAANGGMQAHLEGNFQLGTYAVHARDQDGIGVLDFVDCEQAAEAADFAEHAAGERFVGQVLDALLGAGGADRK